ncbi:MAG TPA: protein kinase [Polyangiaceae bacterium]|nr:protein kinase [Polyangiaceae bacterium]
MTNVSAAPAAAASRYEVIRCLGQGGMGIVYEAFDRQRHERVAMKTLLHFDPSSLYRFKQEFRTLADVQHPNLVHLHELVAGERDEVFFTMELVLGTDFLGYVQSVPTGRGDDSTEMITASTNASGRRRISTRPAAIGSDSLAGRASPADFDRLRRALAQLVDGVSALHAAGKLHRDLKPSNVRVTHEGRVVILDFGVATELRPRARVDGAEDEVVGTVTYMAPEQASGETPGAPSDWYSVGAVLYEAIVGRPPFTGSSVDILTRKCTITPLAPSACVSGVPQDLDDLCMSLLAQAPETRPDAREILRRLGATPSDKAPAPRVEDDPESTLLVGRASHLDALNDAFQVTREGRPVAVRISGLSGLGKSAVAHRFLDDLEHRSDVLVLRGRAYEREAVPFKAVDSVIDALSRHLMRVQADANPLPLPDDMWALAHVFPVLQRVESVGEPPRVSTFDPQVVRQRAFEVLRELFGSLAKRQRVVVFIDDVQWGDTDSAVLLAELMRPPDAPPLMLVTTHRAEEAETSPFLADLRARWPEETPVRDVAVGPLEADDARRLALSLLGADNPSAAEIAESIARESGGSPFLVEELARGASAQFRVGLADPTQGILTVTLEQMVGERVTRLPEDARRFLETVAIGGRPLPVTTVAAAAGVGDSATRLVALLRARRFVRAGLRNGLEVVETIHDRVRQTLVAQLDAETERRCHAELAGALETTPDSDPEALATHLLGAGDTARAAHHAERAAEQALTKLAFAQAARLYQMKIAMLPASAPDVRRLHRRAAEASEWAGLAENAARAYLAAAEGVPLLERVDLERLAAAQLIAAGQIDEGAAIFRRVLAAVGRPVPLSILGTIFWVIVYRAASTLLGNGKRSASAPAPADRVRLDALYAATRGLTIVDPISAMYVKARYLVDALRSGNPFHIVHAAASEAGTLASRGGVESRRERALFEMARRVAEESKVTEGYALYQITYGICQYVRGQWRAALQTLDVARKQLATARRWNANANVFAVYALTYLGDLREVKARTALLLADAEQRGDRYTAVNLRASHPIAAWLAANDLEGARRHISESMKLWSKTRFLVQHWQAMLWEAEVDLYAGDGARAWDRLRRDAQRLRRSHLLSVQLIRVFTNFAIGRSALASLEGLEPEERRKRVLEVRRVQRALQREGMPWTEPLGAILAAGVAAATGDRAATEDALRRAVRFADAVEMSLYAASARRQLGLLVGGDAGGAIVHEADEAMRLRSVREPGRYARMLVPLTPPA